ncbi:hypothetical protein GCM10022216_21400 [Sphingobacterium kyonggiense]|uniref:6-bladed beta-propeller protein n=1 Tax=Sphingobacterium kyonggiense TaxID=714075 RepID=A0ABP7YU42_9SPHI
MRIISLIFLLAICSNNTFAQRLLHSSDIPVQKLRIIPEQLRGGTVSEQLSDLEYIPLNSGKKDVISSISYVEIIEDRIIFFDYQNGGVFIFDFKGNLIKRLKEIDGYKRKNDWRNYRLEKVGNHFNIIGQSLKAQFDKNGGLIELDQSYKFDRSSPKTKVGSSYYQSSPLFIAMDTIADYALKFQDSVLIKYDTRDSIKASYTPYISLVKVSDNKAYAVFENTYQLFELGEKGIINRKQFIFPLKNTIDTSEYIHFKDSRKSYDFLTKNRSKIFGVGRPIPYKQYLILYISSLGSSSWVAMNLETNEIINLNKILPDKSNDYVEFLDHNFLISDGEYLYSCIYPNSIQSAKDKSREESHELRKSYQEFAKSPNPILVRFKLK